MSSEASKTISNFEEGMDEMVKGKVKNEIVLGIKEVLRNLEYMKAKLSELSLDIKKELDEELGGFLRYLEGDYEEFIKILPQEILNSKDFEEGASSSCSKSHIHLEEGEVELF